MAGGESPALVPADVLPRPVASPVAGEIPPEAADRPRSSHQSGIALAHMSLIEETGSLCYGSGNSANQAMKSTRPIVLKGAAGAALALLAFGSSQASGQQAAPKAANPPPKIGLAFENQPPTAKFTNETGQEL